MQKSFGRARGLFDVAFTLPSLRDNPKTHLAPKARNLIRATRYETRWQARRRCRREAARGRPASPQSELAAHALRPAGPRSRITPATRSHRSKTMRRARRPIGGIASGSVC
eukprot:scaffold59565_cov23-Tisochrysis_lutea.AAC.1